MDLVIDVGNECEVRFEHGAGGMSFVFGRQIGQHCHRTGDGVGFVAVDDSEKLGVQEGCIGIRECDVAVEEINVGCESECSRERTVHRDQR